MNLLFPFTGELAHAFGWAILHSVWQAFLIYACLRIVLRLWPMASARIKYNLAFISLAGIFIWFLVTLYGQIIALPAADITAATQLADTQQLDMMNDAAAISPEASGITLLFPGLEMYLPILAGLYLAGVAVMLIRLLSDLFQLQHIRTTQVQQPGAEWEQYISRLAGRLQITGKVTLLTSTYISVPVMMGYFKPLVLLPAAMLTQLSPEQLEAILLHELAHIKRNDYLLNIFQSIVETILFFNPFVWWITKQIRLEREHCCDDLVIASTAQPLHYARALVALEENRLTANPLAMAAAADKQHLLHRIKRIMEMKTKHLNYSQQLLAILIIATGLVGIAWLNPATGKTTEDRTTSPDQTAVTTPANVQPSRTLTKNATIHNGSYRTIVIANDTVIAMPEPPLPPLADTTVPTAPSAPSVKRSPAAPTPPAPPSAPEMEEYTWQTQQQVKMAMAQLDKVDMKEVQKEVSKALQSIDWKKISQEISANTSNANAEVEKALKNINWSAISDNVAKATANINWDEINNNVRKATANIDWTEIQAEISKARAASEKAFAEARLHNSAKTSAAQAKAEKEMRKSEEAFRKAEQHLRETQNTTEKKVREAARKDAARHRNDDIRQEREEAIHRSHMDQERGDMEAERRAANAERESANHQRTQTNAMINEMKKDNLLGKGDAFKINYRDNTLYINDVKQSAEVLSRYKKYLGKVKKMDINYSADNRHVSIED